MTNTHKEDNQKSDVFFGKRQKKTIFSILKQQSVKIILIVLCLLAVFMFIDSLNPVFMIRTKGGLGNKMFLLAGQLAYAKHFNKNVCLEEPFDDSFNIPIRRCSKYEIFKAKRHSCAFARYSPLLFTVDGCLTISNGYLQDERFFAEERDIIKRMFQLARPLPKHLQVIINKIAKVNSVAVHIRRSDYLKYPRIYPKITLQYYEAGADYIQKHSKSPIHLFIFSDDYKWVKTNFKSKYPFTIIAHNTPADDLFLMSVCHHNIIANSTFSWWGAYLNKHTDKIVIAPDHWNNRYPWWGEDIILRDWVVLPSDPKAKK